MNQQNVQNAIVRSKRGSSNDRGLRQEKSADINEKWSHRTRHTHPGQSRHDDASRIRRQMRIYTRKQAGRTKCTTISPKSAVKLWCVQTLTHVTTHVRMRCVLLENGVCGYKVQGVFLFAGRILCVVRDYVLNVGLYKGANCACV